MFKYFRRYVPDNLPYDGQNVATNPSLPYATHCGYNKHHHFGFEIKQTKLIALPEHYAASFAQIDFFPCSIGYIYCIAGYLGR